MNDDVRARVIAIMQPMLAEAREKKMLLQHAGDYAPMSPDELEREWANGNFIWGPVNWKLVDPSEVAIKLHDDVLAAIKKRNEFIRKHVHLLDVDRVWPCAKEETDV